MKTLTAVLILMLAVSLFSCETVPRDQTTLLPGLTYYDGNEKLSGRLVFLFCNDLDQGSHRNDDTCAAIYEFDLDSKKLSKLTDCPSGELAAFSGDLLCVKYCLGNCSVLQQTNVMVYSTKTHQQRILSLKSTPNSALIVGDHVFFGLRGSDIEPVPPIVEWYQTTNGVGSETTIIDYDFVNNQLSVVKLPGASLWHYVSYQDMHRPSGHTNILHFQYSTMGKRVSAGRDYPNGYYSMDPHTGDIRWVSDGLVCKDDEKYSPPITFNGRRILFIGENGWISGHELISTAETDPDPRTIAAERKNNNVLHIFPGYSSMTHLIDYNLVGISPNKHYVLVRKSETAKKSITGEIATYYLVDVVTGNTRVLLKDETGTIGKGAIQSPLFWVGDGN